jgi:phosphotransferase system IIB component
MPGAGMTDKMTFENQVRLSRNLQRIAKLLEKELKQAAGCKVLFSLYTWSGQRVQYVSNSNRDDVKTAMLELLARWENNSPDDPPPHTWGA